MALAEKEQKNQAAGVWSPTKAIVTGFPYKVGEKTIRFVKFAGTVMMQEAFIQEMAWKRLSPGAVAWVPRAPDLRGLHVRVFQASSLWNT
jgi:hypothetical protein